MAFKTECFVVDIYQPVNDNMNSPLWQYQPNRLITLIIISEWMLFVQIFLHSADISNNFLLPHVSFVMITQLVSRYSHLGPH